ncbi:MAG: HAD hydrolase-like protein [Bacteroidales bacterium]|nr:HAD hydrolase-like protein [Bacteroidales bacterium]
MTAASYDHIIFDLDGTLSDSRKGIFNATVYMTEQLGMDKPSAGQFSELIGPPLQQGLKQVFKLDDKKIDFAVQSFRKYYSETGIFENELYPGIFQLLDNLMKAGKSLYIATSKLEIYAKRVLQYFNIHNFFLDVAGADYNGFAGGKETLILTLFRRNGIRNPDRVVLVGDSKYDIQASNALGIDSVGVTYGFSPHDEMVRCEPDYLAGSVEELHTLLTGKE